MGFNHEVLLAYRSLEWGCFFKDRDRNFNSAVCDGVWVLLYSKKIVKIWDFRLFMRRCVK